jgi:hypothetical protein
MDKSANLRYQGPEQRSRKLPKSLSRVQHGYGTCLPCYHSRYSQAIVHFNESWLTSKCLWHSGGEQRAFDQLLVRLAQSR